MQYNRGLAGDLEDLEREEIETEGVGDVEEVAEAFGEEGGGREDCEVAVGDQGEFEGKEGREGEEAPLSITISCFRVLHRVESRLT